VEVLCRRDHLLRALGGPVGGHEHVATRVEPLAESPCGVERRDADRLGGDVRVGGALGDRLERRERLTELRAGGQVVGRLRFSVLFSL
jgi:hypothetical protein